MKGFRFVAGSSALAIAVLAGVSAFPAAADPAALGIDIQYEVLSTDTQDPLSVTVASDGRVIWTEREGELNVLTPDGEQISAGVLPVSANACDDCLVADEPVPLEEGGLYSVLLAPDFDDTGRLYLFRSVPGSRGTMPGYGETFGFWRLSTFVLSDDNVLDLESEVPILDVPAEWDHCCHYGGDMMYLPDGTILLTTGDDVPASSSMGYGPRDVRDDWKNAELSSSHPGDKRGKILRLMPDGSVPDGSQPGIAPNPYIGQSALDPYVPDTSGDPNDHVIAYDPYVYSLGYKQPFRGAVDMNTGTAYFDDVGPDAFVDSPTMGPRGYEEINVVRPGGGVHHGWPRCIADNRPYHDFDWVTMTDNGPLDCSEMTSAVLWYPHDISPEWPQVLAGGTTSIPATIYPSWADGPLRLPERFNDKLIVFEFSRDVMFTIPVKDDGSLDVGPAAVERQLIPRALNTANPNANGLVQFANPIDAAVGPDGALYVLEYGSTFYNNPVGSSKLSRIACAGCEPAATQKTARRPDLSSMKATGARTDLRANGVAQARTPQPAPGMPVAAHTADRGRLGLSLAVAALGIVVLVGGRRRRVIAT